MRPIISYDDITISQTVSPAPASGSQKQNHSLDQPQFKKRKRNSKKQSGQRARYVQHWDEPVPLDQQVIYDAPDGEEYAEDEMGLFDESRELTHDEIWDDSALIDAWDAAAEEYERFHGPEKSWKGEPGCKSALLLQTTKNTGDGTTSVSVESEVYSKSEQDSHPHNFDTFVPIHDPSLSQLHPEMTDTNMLPSAAASISDVTPDEAFSKALNAMYWTGYWTAVYHCRKSPTTAPCNSDGEDARQMFLNIDDNGDKAESEVEALTGEDLVPSQR